MSKSYRQNAAYGPSGDRTRRSTPRERSNLRFGRLVLRVHIPARITAVTSIRDHKSNVIGWQFKCWTCNTTDVFMKHQRDRADARIETHHCRKTQADA